MKKLWKWSPATTVLAGLILTLWLSTVVWSQGQNFPTGTISVNAVFPSLVDPSTFGAKGDAHQISLTTTTGLNTSTITAGSCSSSDIGKKVYSINSSKGSQLALTTVTGCSGTTLTTVGLGLCNCGGLGYIGTDDRIALNAAAAATLAGQTLYLGSRTYLTSGQIFSTVGLFASGQTAAVLVRGDYTEVGANTTLTCSATIVYPPFDITSGIITSGGLGANFSDICIDPGFPASLSGGPFTIFFFQGQRADRIAVNNWQQTNAVCISIATDGSQLRDIYSVGCYHAFKDGATALHIFYPYFNAVHIGFWNFDTQTKVYGGQIFGGDESVLSDNQAGFGEITFFGTSIPFSANNSFGIQTVSGSKTYLYGSFVGGVKGCNNSVTPNTGVNVVSGASLYAIGSQFCSNGANTSIANAGTFYDWGGNTFPTIGAGTYSGAGNLFGSTSISGTLQTAGNFADGAGLGTSTFGTVSGGSTHGQVTITYAGALTTTPIFTMTFPTAFFVAPTCTLQDVGGTNAFPTAIANGAISTTSVVFNMTFAVAPTAANTDTFIWNCLN